MPTLRDPSSPKGPVIPTDTLMHGCLLSNVKVVTFDNMVTGQEICLKNLSKRNQPQNRPGGAQSLLGLLRATVFIAGHLVDPPGKSARGETRKPFPQAQGDGPSSETGVLTGGGAAEPPTPGCPIASFFRAWACGNRQRLCCLLILSLWGWGP